MRDRRLVDYYNKRASEYEQIYYRPIADRRKELSDEADYLRQLAGTKDVVELVCGTGYWTQVMSESAAHIVASDISAEMLAEASKKPFVGPVKLVRADLYSLPFAPQCCDLLVVGFWFSHHPKQDYTRLFDVLTALVRKGGQIWLIDNNPPAEGNTHESAGTDEFGNNYRRRQLLNGQTHDILKNYFTERQLEEIFLPGFVIDRLWYGKYYWTVVLRPR